jgi:hypothetical protein
MAIWSRKKSPAPEDRIGGWTAAEFFCVASPEHFEVDITGVIRTTAWHADFFSDGDTRPGLEWEIMARLQGYGGKETIP